MLVEVMAQFWDGGSAIFFFSVLLPHLFCY